MIAAHGRARTRIRGAMGALVLALASRAAAGAPAGQAVVLSAVENMYSGASHDTDVVSQALLGQVVGVLEARDGFARIETPDRYAGWVPVRALFEYPDPKAPRLRRARHGRGGDQPHGQPLP